MPDIKHKLGASGTLTMTGLDGLIDGATVTSLALENDTDKHLTIDLMLKVRYTSSAPSAGTIVADLYLRPALDGTNQATAGGSPSIPQQAILVAQFEARNPSTSAFEYLAALHIPLPIGTYRLLLVNRSGRTFYTPGNELRYRTVMQQG